MQFDTYTSTACTHSSITAYVSYTTFQIIAADGSSATVADKNGQKFEKESQAETEEWIQEAVQLEVGVLLLSTTTIVRQLLPPPLLPALKPVRNSQ